MLPTEPRGQGIVLAFLVLCEGIWLLFNQGKDGIFEGWSGLGQQNPFRALQLWLLLWTGIADVALSFYAILGLTILLRESVILLFWYRCLVTLIAAPFAGVLISWSAPHSGQVATYISWFIYIAVNVGITYFLGYVLAAERRWHRRKGGASSDSEANEEQGLADGDGDSPGRMPKALGILPLDFAVAAWMMTTGVVSFVWVFRLCITNNFMVGGWAFMATFLPYTASTKWLEVVAHIIAIISALCGLVGIIKYKEISWDEFLLPGAKSENQEGSLKTKKSGNTLLMVAFICNLLRVALFFPITGMVLFKKNFCGFYTKARDFSAWTHCSGEDIYVWCWGMIVLIVDLYLLWGMFQLWHHNDVECSLRTKQASAYGSVDGADVAEFYNDAAVDFDVSALNAPITTKQAEL